MSLAREIKDLSIALQALHAFSSTVPLRDNVQDLLETKISQLYQEINSPKPEPNPTEPNQTDDDEIPF